MGDWFVLHSQQILQKKIHDIVNNPAHIHTDRQTDGRTDGRTNKPK